MEAQEPLVSPFAILVAVVAVVVGAAVIATIAALRARRRAYPRSNEVAETAAGDARPTTRLTTVDPPQVGPYRMRTPLGGGGMGRVFLGSSPGGHTVAVKVVHTDLADDPAFRRRFATEVEAARRVGGFYTAQVVDADPDGDPPWLATAYIPGPSLHEAVRDHGPLPPASVAALGAGLAEGLMAVHACHLVHRDLKPGNVILASDGPRVIDFGIARALDAASATRTSTVLGTAAFMSPEQVRGEEVGAPTDVFALGCVLAYASTGRSPFGEGPAHAVTHRIVYADPDLSGLPAPLADLVSNCLAKDPATRMGLDRVLADLAALAPTGRGHGEGRWLPEAVTEDITLRRTRGLEPEPLSRPPVPEDAGRDAKTRPDPPPRQPAARTAAAVMALLCLLTVPTIPFATAQAVTIGARTPGSLTVHMTLCGVLAVVLAIGALLLLLRNTAGRWLIAAGGTGLALQAVTIVPLPDFIGLASSLTILTAAACVFLAVFPFVGSRR